MGSKVFEGSFQPWLRNVKMPYENVLDEAIHNLVLFKPTPFEVYYCVDNEDMSGICFSKLLIHTNWEGKKHTVDYFIDLKEDKQYVDVILRNEEWFRKHFISKVLDPKDFNRIEVSVEPHKLTYRIKECSCKYNTLAILMLLRYAHESPGMVQCMRALLNYCPEMGLIEAFVRAHRRSNFYDGRYVHTVIEMIYEFALPQMPLDFKKTRYSDWTISRFKKALYLGILESNIASKVSQVLFPEVD